MKINDAIQGSPEWLQVRAGCITASRAKDARSRLKTGKPSSAMEKYAKQVAVERVAGEPVEKFFVTEAMRFGTEQEPLARAQYEVVTGHLVEEAGFITSDDGLFGYSSDGLVGEDGCIEIKTLVSCERIVDLIGSKDVSDFIDQVKQGLWLTNRKWCDVVLWAPALKKIKREMTIVHVDRVEDEIAVAGGDGLVGERRPGEEAEHEGKAGGGNRTKQWGGSHGDTSKDRRCPAARG